MRARWLALATIAFAGCFEWDVEALCRGGARCPSPPDGGERSDGGEPLDAGNVDPEDAGSDGGQPEPSRSFGVNGFTWENPLPHGNDLRAVWGSGPSDVWAGGSAGMLMHWDGQRWTQHRGVVPLDETAAGDVVSLWGDDLGTVWVAAAGRSSLWQLRRDGGSFDATEHPLSFAQPHQLGKLELTGSGPSAFLQGDHGYVASFDGTRWVERSLPGLDTWAAAGVAWVGPSPVFAWQRWCCTGPTPVALSFHELDGGLAGIPAASLPSEVTALWSTGAEIYFSALWDVFAQRGDAGFVIAQAFDEVIYAGSIVPGTDAGFLAGGRETLVSFPGGFPQAKSGMPEPDPDLHALATFADGGHWAVGTGGALVQHASGNQWYWRLRGASQQIAALTASPEGIVGFGQDGTRHVRNEDGGWSAQFILGSPNPGENITDAYAHPDTGFVDLITDRSYYLPYPKGARTELWLDGGTPHAVWRPSPQHVWVAGENGTLFRIEGSVATPVPVAGAGSPPPHWYGLDGLGDSEAWLVGSDGAAARFDGTAWSRLDAGVTDALEAVWAAAPGEAWAVGHNYTLVRLTPQGGERWSVNDLSATARPADLKAVWGFSPDDVWAVGSDGVALHFGKNGWSYVETGTRNVLRDVRGRQQPGGGRDLWLVGDWGTVLYRRE